MTHLAHLAHLAFSGVVKRSGTSGFSGNCANCVNCANAKFSLCSSSHRVPNAKCNSFCIGESRGTRCFYAVGRHPMQPRCRRRTLVIRYLFVEYLLISNEGK